MARKKQAAAAPPETAAAKPTPDYKGCKEQIRAIANGRNARHEMLSWRAAVELWEQANGRDEKGRAAFFVSIGIATAVECKLLTAADDTPPEGTHEV